VTAIAETAILVRYLTGSPPALAEAARVLIDGDESLLVPVVAIHETAFVLVRHYDLPRDLAIDLIVDLLHRENIDTLDVERAYLIEGLQMCRGSGRIAFGDALIWAAARSRPAGPLVTFDRRFPRDGLDVRVLA
jgi:predicted nucleic acid-binding protein